MFISKLGNELIIIMCMPSIVTVNIIWLNYTYFRMEHNPSSLSVTISIGSDESLVSGDSSYDVGC